MKVRIHNTTPTHFPPGHALDFDGKFINRGKHVTVDIPTIPEILEDWIKIGKARVEEVTDATTLSALAETVVTKGTDIQEATADDNFEEDDIFDLSDAKEATLVSADPAPKATVGLDSAPKRGAKVSLGSQDENLVADGLSPIPGDKPVSIDNAEAFTIRAPRSNEPGSVVRKN
jgi:hypothetical protein